MACLQIVCTAGTDFSHDTTCTLDTNPLSLSVRQITKSTGPTRRSMKGARRAKAAEKGENPQKGARKGRTKEVKK